MRVLVTGCAGFIGSHLCDRLLALEHEVVGVDCLVNSYPRAFKEANLKVLRRSPGFSFHELELAADDLRPAASGVEVVYHQAAQAGDRTSWGHEFDATFATISWPRSACSRHSRTGRCANWSMQKHFQRAKRRSLSQFHHMA